MAWRVNFVRSKDAQTETISANVLKDNKINRNFKFISETSKYLPVRSRSSKKICWVENFPANVD